MSGVGYSGKRIGKLLMTYSETVAELIHSVQDELLSDAPDRKKMLRAINELQLRNAYLKSVGAGLVEGRLDVSEQAAARMTGDDKGVQL